MTETEQEYFQICAWRYLHPLPKTEYGEVHHILPRSCGGMDKIFNLVKLTPEEHYECHKLLPTIFNEKGAKLERRKMAFAWCIMHKRNGVEISAEEYGEMRREIGEAQSGENNPFYGKHHDASTIEHLRTINLGENNPMFGKQLSEETKKLIGDSNRGKPHNISEEGMANIRAALCGRVVKEETRNKLREAHKGKPNSEESRRKNSEYSSAARWYHNEERSFFILPTDEKIKALGLVPGRMRKKKCQQP